MGEPVPVLPGLAPARRIARSVRIPPRNEAELLVSLGRRLPLPAGRTRRISSLLRPWNTAWNAGVCDAPCAPLCLSDCLSPKERERGGTAGAGHAEAEDARGLVVRVPLDQL